MSPVSPSREIAFAVLERVRAGSFVEDALSAALSQSALRREDRTLATELVYGVVRWRLRLDGIIDRCAAGSGKPVKPRLRQILRIALYQIIFLSKIPDRAAVDEAVSQARHRVGPGPAGFVNALLRNALRNRSAADPPPADTPASVSVYYSHPEWLVARWIGEFGKDLTRRILEHNNSRASLDLRVNTLKTTREDVVQLLQGAGIAAEPIGFLRDGLAIPRGGGPVHTLPGYEDGLFAVQERASQMVAPLLRPVSGGRILDACAAPGGKTAHLAALVEKDTEIIAMDEQSRRVAETRKNLQRLGASWVEVRRGDATDPNFIRGMGSFDRILLDPPCTGLGVLRHNPETKYRLTAQDPAAFAARQLQMLTATAPALRPGGELLYSVCTVTPEETTGVVSLFLAQRPGFACVPVDEGEVGLASLISQGRYFRTFPSPENEPMDGFFAARICRL
ncbi:MAG: 16S rRNA (cytosine(967)-C(5))-methyltransferase RsmB [Desulfomonile tiedjei]|nr:16S rRNA (cytosine(967)-C(5))-methyltransferase RsmB [Desulfomonile tiedjei]